MQLTDATDLARQIVFIDTGLPYWEVLAAEAPEGAEVILLDPAQDGVLQIAASLEDRDGFDASQFKKIRTPQFAPATPNTEGVGFHVGEKPKFQA